MFGGLICLNIAFRRSEDNACVSATCCFVMSFSCRKTNSFEKSSQSHKFRLLLRIGHCVNEWHNLKTIRSPRQGFCFSGLIIQLLAVLGGVRDTVIGLRHSVTSAIFFVLEYRPTSIVNLCHFLDGILL